MTRPRVCLVGAGWWGRNILRVLKELELEGSAEVVSVVDRDLRRAESLAREFRVSSYAGSLSELKPSDVDAAVIAVGIDFLYQVSREAIDLGLHVFVEKPVSVSPEEVRSLLIKAGSKGVVHQVGYIMRFDEVSLKIREMVNTEGPPNYVTFMRLSERPEHRRRFSIVFDLMTHDIDLTFFWFNPRTYSVKYVLKSLRSHGVPQVVEAVVDFGSFWVHYVVDGVLPVKVREVNLSSSKYYLKGDFVEGVLRFLSRGRKELIMCEGEEPLKRELRVFLRRVSGEEVEAPTLKDALKVAELAHLIDSKE